jgi:parvulin-like peptidyl-prolyl isomerase
MKINGTTVPNGRFEMEWQRLNQAKQQDPQLGAMPEDHLRQLTQNNVIGQVLLEEHVRGQNEKVPAADVDKQIQAMIKEAGNEKRFLRKYNLKKSQMKDFKAHVEHNFRMQRFMNSLASDVPEPTDSDVEEEYSKNPMQFNQPEMLHASHIVKHTNDGTPKEDAHKVILQAKKQLEEGAEFDVLCRQFSDCKGQSGDLGWFPRGQMVQGFEDVIFKMKPDEISDIFETEFGYHIAKLHEKKPATVTPFDQVKDTLKTQLWEQRRHDAVETLVGELRGKAKIEQ